MERLDVALDAALGQVAAALAPADAGARPEDADTGRRVTTGYEAGLCWLAYMATGEARLRAAGEAAVAAAGRRLHGPGGAVAPDLGLTFALAAVNPWRLTGNELARGLALAAARALCHRFHPAPAGCIDGAVTGPGLLNLPLLLWAAAETGDGRPALLALRHLEAARARLDPAGPERGWCALGFGLAYSFTGDDADLAAARAAAGAVLERGAPAGTACAAAAGLLEVAEWLGPTGGPYREGACRLLAAGPGPDPAGHYFYLEALLRLDRHLRPAWAGG